MVSMHGHFSFPLTAANMKTQYHFVEHNVNLDFSSFPYVCFFTKKRNNVATKEVVTCLPCLNKMSCSWCGMQSW